MPAVKKSTRGWRQSSSKKPSTSKDVIQLKRQVRSIKKSQELKWFDLAVNDPIAGSIYALNNVPQGDDSTTRDGRKIVMKSLMCRINAIVSSATLLPAAPRYMIVYDKVPNGVLPAVTDIVTGASSAVLFPNLNNRDRFRILYDNYAGFGNNSQNAWQVTGSANPVNAAFVDYKYIKLKDLQTIYKDTGSGTIAGTNTGGLYVVFLGGGNSTTGSQTNFRIRFYDS